MTAAEGERSRVAELPEEGSAKGIDCLVRSMVLEYSGRLEAACLSFLPRDQLGPLSW